MNSRVLSDPIRLLDCVPIVNGGLAYIVTSAKTARTLTDRPVYLRGFGESNNFYKGSRSLPTSRTPASRRRAAGHEDGRCRAQGSAVPAALRRLPVHLDDDGGGLRLLQEGRRRFVEERNLHSTATSRCPPMAASCPAASRAAPRRFYAAGRGGHACEARRGGRSRTRRSARRAASAAFPTADTQLHLTDSRNGALSHDRLRRQALPQYHRPRARSGPPRKKAGWCCSARDCATFNFHPKPWCIECGNRDLPWTEPSRPARCTRSRSRRGWR